MKKLIILSLIAIVAVLFKSNVSLSAVSGCMDSSAENYDNLATIDDGSCKYAGTSWLSRVSRIDDSMYRTFTFKYGKEAGNYIEWLSNKKATSKLLVSKRPVALTLNEYNKVRDSMGNVINSSDGLYGYEFSVNSLRGTEVYHLVNLNVLPKGTWFVRPVANNGELFVNDFLGKEMRIEVK